jgi:hypothetical protein
VIIVKLFTCIDMLSVISISPVLTWTIFKTARVLPQPSNFLPSHAFEARRA